MQLILFTIFHLFRSTRYPSLLRGQRQYVMGSLLIRKNIHMNTIIIQQGHSKWKKSKLFHFFKMHSMTFLLCLELCLLTDKAKCIHIMTSIFTALGNLPVERAKDGVCFLQRGGLSLASSAIIYNIVKVKVTRWPVDPFDPLTCGPIDPSTR